MSQRTMVDHEPLVPLAAKGKAKLGRRGTH